MDTSFLISPVTVKITLIDYSDTNQCTFTIQQFRLLFNGILCPLHYKKLKRPSSSWGPFAHEFSILKILWFIINRPCSAALFFWFVLVSSICIFLIINILPVNRIFYACGFTDLLNVVFKSENISKAPKWLTDEQVRSHSLPSSGAMFRNVLASLPRRTRSLKKFLICSIIAS